MIADNVIKILNSNSLYAKKKYGQNFLIDKNVLNKIIDISNVSADDIVIEIGPGMGCLTELLCMKAKKVICYEIDNDMVEILNQNVKTKFSNIEIINIDFLKADLTIYNDKKLGRNIKVVANLPYYITSQIILKLLSETKITQFTFMVQKEVGERLTGKPNTKDYNALSVIMGYKTNSKLVCKVSHNSFYPVPKVESAILLVKTKENDSEANFEGDFLKFVQIIFLQRRKTIINNLLSKYDFSKEELIKIFNKNNLDINLRAESLGVEEIKKMYNILISNE